MASPPHEKLTRREREIMDAIFALGDSASAEDVRARLSDPPSYSAVRAMLVKLETKGFIQKLVSVFFGGSPSHTVTALLKQETWTDEELDALRAEIDEVRKNRRKP
jgi:predicted transcriptional regulator